MKKLLSLLLAVGGLMVPSAVLAQANDGGLANLVPNLILTGITLPGAADPGRPHAAHFTLGTPTVGGQAGSQADAPSVIAVEAFGDRLRAQLANIPLGSSTGGFTFSFDEGTGIYTRNRDSFGPAFAERAATIGRRKLSLGLSYQHSSFDKFAGQDLRDGSIKFYLPHTDCCPPNAQPTLQRPGFESDIMQADLELQATADTVALFANYGVTDRFDVGLAVPITRIDLEVNVHAHILRLATADSSLVHTFVEGQDVSERIFTESGTATGFGDIIVRTKYNFLNRASTGLAAAVDLRLPTGDEDDLLGVGAAQAKFFLIISSTGGRFSPHFNFGYTVSGSGSRQTQFLFEPLAVSDEVNFAGGVEFVAHPRLTLVGDIVGRTQLDAGDIGLETRTYQVRVGSGSGADVPVQTSSLNPITGQPYEQLALRPGNLSQVFGAAGFKYNAGPNLLLMAHALFPLNDAGVTDRLTLAFGMEYAF